MDSGNLKGMVGKKMKSQKRCVSHKKSRGRGDRWRENYPWQIVQKVKKESLHLRTKTLLMALLCFISTVDI